MFLKRGLITAVFRVLGEKPERREVLIIARRSDAMQIKKYRKLVGRISRQQEEELIHNSVLQGVMTDGIKLCHAH